MKVGDKAKLTNGIHIGRIVLINEIVKDKDERLIFECEFVDTQRFAGWYFKSSLQKIKDNERE